MTRQGKHVLVLVGPPNLVTHSELRPELTLDLMELRPAIRLPI